jgi:hypothetical protein
LNECPVCDGPGVLLGALGHVVWLRCRDCGWDYQATTLIDLDDEHDDEDDDALAS